MGYQPKGPIKEEKYYCEKCGSLLTAVESIDGYNRLSGKPYKQFRYTCPNWNHFLCGHGIIITTDNPTHQLGHGSLI